ncbi:MAG: hypothetical protein RLY31_3212 [Bacteroidota bacterium]|jgi:phosphatidylserine decarboxylase
MKRVLLFGLVVVGVAVLFYFGWFLRNPERQVPQDPGMFVSPANGRVAAVVHWNADSLSWRKDLGVVQVMTGEVDTAGWLVAIEMNVMNVHYQRAPMAARLIGSLYTEGRFNNALVRTNRFGLRLENERNDMLFETDAGLRFKVVQVAGLLARRIVGFLSPGQSVAVGETIGVIRMGSQVALVLPSGTEPLVKEGDYVIDGESWLARVLP